MKKRKFSQLLQQVVGTAFLLAGAVFIGATFLSARAVFADPVIFEQQAATARTSMGQTASQRRQAARTTNVARGAVPAPSRAGASRATAAPSRAVSVRSQAASPNRAVASRAVSARSGGATMARGVQARSGTTQASRARISLAGTAVTGSRGSTNSGILSTKLYTGTYSNIIDTTTGLISADAYNNCLSSYYTCMDEICTARNSGQRRCACAGRVKTFSAVEATLQQSKEDLLKVSGELSLLIMTKGKDINAAFQLTDAEKTLNCVSYREAKRNGTTDQWCKDHMYVTADNTGGVSSTSTCQSTAPTYCTDESIGLGPDWENILNGADSDILAGLTAYADAINKIEVINTNDNDDLLWSVGNVVSALDGTSNVNLGEETKDTLATTWGYDLFKYAHNNVCSRVLDSCFNGIYEKCTGTTPENCNSQINVSSDGADLIVVQKCSNTGTAACFGYTSTSGDPYASLRGPVADSRRSILQKYALDANADCDLYGNELKKQAQNMAYQKIAATQLLQKKRLEFSEEGRTALAAAKQNYYKCQEEILDCYEIYNGIQSSYRYSKVKTQTTCHQIGQIPTCYENMVCDQTVDSLIEADQGTIYANRVSLTEILTAAASSATGGPGQRQTCLTADNGIRSIREYSWNVSWTTCASGQHDEGGYCVSNTKVCVKANALTSQQSWNGEAWNPCMAIECMDGYAVASGSCVATAAGG